MNDPQLGNPESTPQPLDPFALGSIILSVVGVVVYCCGSFLCIGWIGFFVWVIGAICAVVSVAMGAQGSNKIMAFVGLALNLFCLFGMVALVALGVGASVLSSAAGY